MQSGNTGQPSMSAEPTHTDPVELAILENADDVRVNGEKSGDRRLGWWARR